MASEPASATTFSPEQVELLRDVLDRLIPSNERLPGAGESGIADYVAGAAAESKGLSDLLANGLALIESVSQADHSNRFRDLSGEQRDGVLKRIEQEQELFFQELVRHTYNGYYSNSRVIEALGLDPRPPQPRGYTVEAGNLALIENVKRRGQMYRDA